MSEQRFRVAQDGGGAWYVQDAERDYYPMDVQDERHAHEISDLLNKADLNKEQQP